MAIFKFRARNAKTGEPIKVEIYLGGVDKGFTPDKENTWLMVETSQSGRYSWYAKYWGDKIASGESSGGEIEILYSPE